MSWGAPALVVASAAPALAVSQCTQVTRDFNYTGAIVPVAVPTSATYVDFLVRGAGGGSPAAGTNWSQGALVRGRIEFASPSSPRSFVLAVGGGGLVTTNGTTAAGGWGYGTGGASTPGARETSTAATGGGGGGSAILIAGANPRQPLVVSGGGGGQSVGHTISGVTGAANTHASPGLDFQYGRGSAGGDGNGRAIGMAAIGQSATGLAVNPSIRGIGAEGGRGGGTNHFVASGTGNWTGSARERGFDGGDHGSGFLGGGNGGNGADRLSNGSSMRASAGGGGGGYAGGGGGGLAGSTYTGTNGMTISSGSGAGGSSYVASSAAGLTLSHEPFTNPGLAGTDARGAHGFIRLTWCE